MIIVCAIDNNYIRHCAVMLRSLYEANSAEEISVYIIHDAIDVARKKKLADYLGGFLKSVSFVQIDPNMLKGLPVNRHITVSTYYRFLLPSVLPRAVEKALFLDCDLIVVGSLGELWRTPLDRYPLAAVSDHGIKWNCKRLGIPEGLGYFNCGVMLIDVGKWRARDILKEGLEFARGNLEKLINWDQDIFNCLFQGQWLRLDPRWNACPDLWGFYKGNADEGIEPSAQDIAARNNPGIVHFAGGGTVKPWDYRCQHPWKKRYLELKKKTPWAKVPLDFQPPIWAVRIWRGMIFRVKCLAKDALTKAD
jgi:lipopolysaccharide biosynthesis glycosyltransferase